MKRTTKAILFLAVAAITFAGLHAITGRNYRCPGNRSMHCHASPAGDHFNP